MLCYTIGHSNSSSEEFAALLKRHGINRVIDVRSAPYSRYAPQFNKEQISLFLEGAGIAYEYRGDKLGGRHSNPAVLFPDGKVNFSLVRIQQSFVRAPGELMAACSGPQEKVCLMCAEKEPFDCHRFVLLGRHLAENGVRVEHIRSDGTTVEQRDLELKLLKQYEKRNYQFSLFEQPPDERQLLAQAYELRNKDIVPSNNPSAGGRI